MLSKHLLALGVKATLVVGITPSGFTPDSNTDLIVVYGQTAAMNGVVVDQAATASAPTIATRSRLEGTSYAVIMVDLGIPSTQNPHTFLHWLQTGLSPATTASNIATSNGSTRAFTLSNASNTSAMVAYTQPAPPAQDPLSHRYAQVLVDTSAVTPAGLSALRSAAGARVGFDTESALRAAGLSSSSSSSSVVAAAGNFFNVTNPGPAGLVSPAAGAGNLSSAGTGNPKEASKLAEPGGGPGPFGMMSGGGGRTLTTTISSAPAGPTSGLTNAVAKGGEKSSAPGALGRDPAHLRCLLLTVVVPILYAGRSGAGFI